MAMNRATNTITPGEIGGGASIPQPAQPAPSPTGQDLVKQMRGYNKGTAKVAPMPVHGSFRGDNSGSLSKEEFAGIPHLVMANKKK